MTGEEYAKLRLENPDVGLVRPFWNLKEHNQDEKKFHQDLWRNKGITVLICQRRTKDIVQLCLESLLRFYPDIPVLVVDGDSQDESTLYLLYKSLVSPNVRVWQRPAGINSHGMTMHEAIMGHIDTEYVLLMDSDVITMRPGYIEAMHDQLLQHKILDKPMYATGTLMLVTRKNYACGAPDDFNDVLRYAHPSCSLYHVPTYKLLNAPFVDHGAPCVYNMMAAEQANLQIGYFPVDKYVTHLSGASWCVPKTIWIHDYDVPMRPFVTFIVTNEKQAIDLSNQNDHDFDMIPLGRQLLDSVIMHDTAQINVNNRLYDLRFKVTGEYVCFLDPNIERIDNVIVTSIKKTVIDLNAPDELNVGGLRIIKRETWQRKECF